MERRLTTILAADIAGYSRLMAADEEGVVSRLQAVRAEVIDPTLSRHGGRIVKTMGDGLLIEFASPVEAVRAGLAVQTRINAAEAAREDDDRMRFRIGVHFGDVLVDGDDLLGDVVNVAARLETLSPVGGICVSRGVRDMISGKVEAKLSDLGPQMVKNMPEPVEVWRVEVAGATSAVKPRAVRTSIAVMPFSGRSEDPDDAFLSDGIVEDVTNELSRFRALTVIASASSNAFRDTMDDARTIGRALDARFLVQGAVRRAGIRLRVTAKLIEAETGVQIWSERWDRTTEDIFDLQDELTRAIVGSVEPELGAHERTLARRKPTESLTSWELCQKGLGELLTYSGDSFMQARATLAEASEIDPDFAQPQAHLARWYWNYLALGHSIDQASDIKQGLAHAHRALSLDDRLDAAYYPLATISGVAGLEDDARDAVDRGLALNPNNALLHHAGAVVSLWSKAPDPDLIEASERRALRLSPKDPLAWGFYYLIGVAKFVRTFSFTDQDPSEDLDIACRYANAGYIAFMVNAVSHSANGRTQEAERYLRRALELNSDLTWKTWSQAFAIPIWPQMLAAQEATLQTLFDLGLPRD